MLKRFLCPEVDLSGSRFSLTPIEAFVTAWFLFRDRVTFSIKAIIFMAALFSHVSAMHV